MDDIGSVGAEALAWAFRASVIAAVAHEERILTFGPSRSDEDNLRRMWSETDRLAERLLSMPPTPGLDARVKREAREWLTGDAQPRRRLPGSRAIATPGIDRLVAEASTEGGRAALAAVGAVLAKAAFSARRRARGDSAATEALRALQKLGKRLQEIRSSPTAPGVDVDGPAGTDRSELGFVDRDHSAGSRPQRRDG